MTAIVLSCLPVRLCQFEEVLLRRCLGMSQLRLDYAAVSSMGLSSWGFRYSTLSGKGSFVQDVFLAHPQKSTSQGCGFDVCQLD